MTRLDIDAAPPAAAPASAHCCVLMLHWTGSLRWYQQMPRGLSAGRHNWDVALVDLDDNYVPRGPPTMLDGTAIDKSIVGVEDPRLFVHRGILYIEFQALQVSLARHRPPPHSCSTRAGRAEYVLMADRLEVLCQMTVHMHVASLQE